MESVLECLQVGCNCTILQGLVLNIWHINYLEYQKIWSNEACPYSGLGCREHLVLLSGAVSSGRWALALDQRSRRRMCVTVWLQGWQAGDGQSLHSAPGAVWNKWRRARGYLWMSGGWRAPAWRRFSAWVCGQQEKGTFFALRPEFVVLMHRLKGEEGELC